MDEEEDEDNEDSAIENEAVAPLRQSPVSKAIARRPPVRKTIVDDKFFQLGSMEEFLVLEDAKEERRLRRHKRGEWLFRIEALLPLIACFT